MSCTGIRLSSNFECGPSHIDRVNNDIVELTKKTGFPFLTFAPYMAQNENYAVCVYPRIITSHKGHKFDISLHDFRGSSHSAFLINSQTKEYAKVPYNELEAAEIQWLFEAEQEQIEAEKEQVRQQLRAVGIEPEW